jgi:hypothetical protein
LRFVDITALLNSTTARLLIAPVQPKGQGGARHFDNLIWELPIPEYDRRIELHRDLATAAATAERVAAAVALPQGVLVQIALQCESAKGLVQNWGCQCVPDIFAPVLGLGVGRGVDFEVGGSRGRGSLGGHHGDQQA